MKNGFCNSLNKLNEKKLNTDLNGRNQEKIVIKSLEHLKLSKKLHVSNQNQKYSYVNPSQTQAIGKGRSKFGTSTVNTLQSLNSSVNEKNKSKFSNTKKETNSNKKNPNKDIIIKINNISNVIQIKDNLKSNTHKKNSNHSYSKKDFSKISNKTNSFNYNSNLFKHIKTSSLENTKSAFNQISSHSPCETVGDLNACRNQISKEMAAKFCSKIDSIDVNNCVDINQIIDCSTTLKGISEDFCKFLPDYLKIFKKSGLKYKEIIELTVQNYNLAINKIQESEATIHNYKKSNNQLLELVEMVEIKNKEIKKLNDKINEIEYSKKRKEKSSEILSSFNNDDEILSTDRIIKNKHFADDLEGILFFDKVKMKIRRHESVSVPKLNLKQAKEIYEKMHERENKAKKQHVKDNTMKYKLK